MFVKFLEKLGGIWTWLPIYQNKYHVFFWHFLLTFLYRLFLQVKQAKKTLEQHCSFKIYLQFPAGTEHQGNILRAWLEFWAPAKSFRSEVIRCCVPCRSLKRSKRSDLRHAVWLSKQMWSQRIQGGILKVWVWGEKSPRWSDCVLYKIFITN